MTLKLIKNTLVGEYVSSDKHLCIESRPSGDGFIVLAFRANHPIHKYVVWYADQEGNCTNGDYHDDLGKARLAFLTR